MNNLIFRSKTISPSVDLPNPLSAISFFATKIGHQKKIDAQQKKDAATIGAMLRFCLSFADFLKSHKISP